MATAKLQITGMHCGHCITKVQTALQGVDGVFGARVDLEDGLADVEYDDSRASTEALISAVEGVGYGATVTV